ncbi:MAG TPA: PrsW family intramembrane metalloprotease [Polyangiaceae bacterium LLY-WYZ-14_1]|nr:PrsW family intramembrane metalloprotease [Polyangiaceae bacterium LLY-WYZ-14_1]
MAGRAPAAEVAPARLPDPDRRRRGLGLALAVVGCLSGACLTGVVFLLPPLFEPNPLDSYLGMLGAAALALPAGLVYLTVPRLLDRYDPEPAYALVGCLLWGATAAVGVSAVVNTAVGAVVGSAFGPAAGDLASGVFSAPLVEEAMKGLGVLGIFWFLRREFDGMVDGVIYATFVALGFATVENVVYYARAASEGGGGALAATFVLRGMLFPWGHPLYTGLFGLGLGLARESTQGAIRLLAPLAGFAAAVLLHAVWNGTAFLAGVGEEGAVVFLLLLPVWFLLVLAYLLLVVLLVARRGRILKRYLADEVALGNLTAEELALVTSATGLWRARWRHGATGVALLRAAARLGLTKWHASRAAQTGRQTVSLDFVAPLRSRLQALRTQL